MLKIIVVNSLIVVVVVLIHYEVLFRLTRLLRRLQLRQRLKVLFGVFVTLVAHAVEIWIFACVYFLMHRSKDWGMLSGHFDGSLMSSVYFSFATYTTLGFGDIRPIGDMRYLVGIQALVGFVLLTWTASFLFVQMRERWGTDGED